MINLMNKIKELYSHLSKKYRFYILCSIAIVCLCLIGGFSSINWSKLDPNKHPPIHKLNDKQSYIKKTNDLINFELTDIVPYGISHVYNYNQMNVLDKTSLDQAEHLNLVDLTDPLKPNFKVKVNNYNTIKSTAITGNLINVLPKFKNAALDYNQAQTKYIYLNDQNNGHKNILDYNLNANIAHLTGPNTNKWFYSPIDAYQRQFASKLAKFKSKNKLLDYFMVHNSINSNKSTKSTKWVASSKQNILTNYFDDEDAPNPPSINLNNKIIKKIINNQGFDNKYNKKIFKGSINSIAYANLLSPQLKYQSNQIDYNYRYLTYHFFGYIPYKQRFIQSFIADSNHYLDDSRNGNMYVGPSYLGKMNQMSDHLPLYIPAITEFGQNNLDQAKLENIYTTYKKYSHLTNSQIDTLYNQIHQLTQYYQQNNQISYNNIEYLTNVDLMNRINLCNSILQSNRANKHLAKNKLNFLHPEKDKSFWKLFDSYVYAYKNKCLKYQKRVNKTKQPIIIQNYGSLTYNPKNNTVIKSSIVSKVINNQKLISYTKYSFKNKASEQLTKIPKGQKNSYVLYKKEKKLVEKQQAFDQIKKLALKHPKKFKKLITPDQTVTNGVAKDFTPKQLVQKTREYLEN